jgi:ferredoxin
MIRKIIKIDEKKCDGCGLCIPNCPEGALQIIDGKAKLVSDLFCDGLGACIGYCPKNAITIEEREAEQYDERKVIKRIAKQGKSVIKAHLEHLREHGENAYLKEALNYLEEKGIANPLKDEHLKDSHFHACPGLRAIKLERKKNTTVKARIQSELAQWPIQLSLVPLHAPYFNNADLLVAADCVPFAYANFHQDFLKNKILLIACPKLDDIEFYKEKLIKIFESNNIKSISVLHMEVPCCYGLSNLVETALKSCGKDIPLSNKIITIDGNLK